MMASMSAKPAHFSFLLCRCFPAVSSNEQVLLSYNALTLSIHFVPFLQPGVVSRIGAKVVTSSRNTVSPKLFIDSAKGNLSNTIEWLRLTSQAVKHPQHSPIYFVSLIRPQGKKVVSSIVILEMQAAWNLRSTTVSTLAVAQLHAGSTEQLRYLKYK